MAVAMKDLEIRGAGNLLGGEQSGHIAGVGFDLYVRLVGEAVADFRGEPAEAEAVDVKVDLPVDANLPVDYLPGERLRLEAYRSLAGATTDEAVDAVRAELLDRYGPIPPPVENLLAVARFKVLCRRYGVTEVSLQGKSFGSRRWTCPTRRSCGCGASTTGRSTSRRCRRCRCRVRRAVGPDGTFAERRSAASRCATSRCSPGAPRSSRRSGRNRRDWAAQLRRVCMIRRRRHRIGPPIGDVRVCAPPPRRRENRSP